MDLEGGIAPPLALSFMATASSHYSALAAALRRRVEVIADREHYQRDPLGHLERLKQSAAEISSIQSQLPDDVDPQLAHFLQRCSYEKALAFIEEKRSR
jgi:hypothetical protein